MAQINYKYYTGKDVYNDGDVEVQLLKHYRSGQEIDKNSDEIFYLTTHIRENILNWYPFTKEDEVLEIGSGCGTLTKMLCRRCKFVCSVEGSKRRAEITYERNRKFDNLSVYAAEFGKFDLDKKFDYVILIGVFEYAKIFFDTEDPFAFFLHEIKKVLKDTGKVLLAIENRYGLKYWAGADEDHLNVPYVGFSQYSDYNVQTFGLKEMADLVEKAGFFKYKFYYPFPDYKLPEIIYTDNRLPQQDELQTLPIYLYGSYANFNIRDVYEGLIQNSQFGFFSNSFIIEFGGNDANLSDIIYAKELSYRKKDYRIVTVQTESLKYKKIALDKDAKNHLLDIQMIYEKMKALNIPVTKQKIENDGKLYVEYNSGESVAQYIGKQISQKGIEGCKAELKGLWNFYCSISEKKKFSMPADERLFSLYANKTEILKLSLMDGNASNIMLNKNHEYIFIDQEWINELELPAEYLMYYSILHIAHVCKIDRKTMNELLEIFNITDQKQKVFLSICETYYTNIIDENTKKKQEDLNKVFERYSVDTVPVCYYDTGEGFNEKQKIYGSYYREGKYYKAYFEVPENTKVIRVDPALCGGKCLSFSEILINGEKIEYQTENIKKTKRKKLLTGLNPFVFFEYSKNSFEFSIDMKPMTNPEIEEYLQLILEEEKMQNCNKDDHLVEKLKLQIDTLQKTLLECQKEKDYALLKCQEFEDSEQKLKIQKENLQEILLSKILCLNDMICKSNEYKSKVEFQEEYYRNKFLMLRKEYDEEKNKLKNELSTITEVYNSEKSKWENEIRRMNEKSRSEVGKIISHVLRSLRRK